MKPDRFALIKKILLEVTDLSEAERNARLDEVSRNDPDLRREVDSILAHENDAIGIMKTGGAGPPAGATSDAHPDTVGPYKILEPIGEGGMGVVYLAEQTEPIRRRVALKVIKLGMDTKQVLARFEAERQALALMDHPNIAKVLDAGETERGLPYFVMDLVKGESITKYCDRHTLSTKERLQLFIPVCHAVQHAHQKGIIHRDLKPSNIMVTFTDARPVPKVIDFGVAKATTATLTDKTLYTHQGQLIGTPEYMSPEQAEMGGLDVDTRTDVYSLGVVLYELLAGALPFDPATLRKKGYAEIQRFLREEEPPKPSTKVSTPGDDSARIAKHRHTDTQSLTKQLRGELDWVVLKAIEKDRTRRYGSPSELAIDIRRYQRQEPVAAGPPSSLYRARKFVRRHTTILLGLTGLFLTLLVALAVSTGLYLRSEQARAATLFQSYLANVRAAEASLRLGDIQDVRRRLAACPEVHRGWEWYWLQANTDCAVAVLRDHTGFVESISFSQDGRLLASASADSTVRIWDTLHGRCVNTFLHEAPVTSVAFSPDGSLIASAAPTRGVYLWETNTGTQRALSNHVWTRVSVDFSPDGARLVSGGTSIDDLHQTFGEITIWEVETGERSLQLDVPNMWGPVSFSPDGGRVACGGYHFQSWSARIWDSQTGELLTTLTPSIGTVNAVAFSPGGTRIYTGSQGHVVRFWDSTSGSLLGTIGGHPGPVKCLAVGPKGGWVVSGSERALRVWSGAWRKGSVLHGHEDLVTCTVISSDGGLIASGSDDGTIRLWDPQFLGGFHLLPYRGGRSISFGPTDLVLAGSQSRFLYMPNLPYENTIRVWNKESSSLQHLLWGHDSPVNSVAYLRTDSLVFSASEDGTVRSWDWQAGSEVCRCQGHTGDVLTVTVNETRGLVASGSADSTIRLWDATTCEPRGVLEGHSGPVTSIVFGLQGERLFSGSVDSTVREWSVVEKRLHRVIGTHSGAVRKVLLSPDGETLMSGSDDRTVACWNLPSGERVRTLAGHDAEILSLAISPDGRRLVTASEDKRVRLWDATIGEPLIYLGGHKTPIEDIAFSADGRTIGVAGRQIGLWTIDAPEAGFRARRTAARIERHAKSLVDSLSSAMLPNEVIDWLTANKQLDVETRDRCFVIAQVLGAKSPLK